MAEFPTTSCEEAPHHQSLHDGVRCFGHGGAAPGMNGRLTICDNGYTIAVLANLDAPDADRVEKFVLPRLPLK